MNAVAYQGSAEIATEFELASELARPLSCLHLSHQTWAKRNLWNSRLGLSELD